MNYIPEIKVSVVCLAYNAERYIAKCLDGFVMQKCNFAYEVFVHDDASTDKTAEIIKEYEKKYPNIIHAIYQKENQYTKKVSILAKHIYPYIHGKYIAYCEGDDYWTDEDKLQKQYDALERNVDCHMSVHRVDGVSENGISNGMRHPNFELATGVIKGADFVDYNCTNEYVFQTSSYFVRAEDEFTYQKENPRFKYISATGDLARMLYFATKGNIYYIDDDMSCYRYGSTSSDARKEICGKTEEKIQIHFAKQIEMMKEYDKYTKGIYHEQCERKINGYLFDKAFRNHDYKEMVKRKYKFFLKKFPIKARIKLRGYAYIPRLISYYDRLRK